MAPEICFPTPSEESSSAIPPASIRREFPKSFNDGEKFGDGEKMDDVGRKSQFRCAASSPSFSRGRMSDTGLGKHAVSGRIKVAIRAKRGWPGKTRIRNQTVTVERHLPIVQAVGRKNVRTRADKPALIIIRAPTAAPGAAPKQSARRTSSTPPHCEAANNIRAGVSRRARPRGSATCRPE